VSIGVSVDWRTEKTEFAYFHTPLVLTLTFNLLQLSLHLFVVSAVVDWLDARAAAPRIAGKRGAAGGKSTGAAQAI
jgi:hypothetical protein